VNEGNEPNCFHRTHDEVPMLADAFNHSTARAGIEGYSWSPQQGNVVGRENTTKALRNTYLVKAAVKRIGKARVGGWG
jgi:hypothetical protein